jgi:phage I-like protein
LRKRSAKTDRHSSQLPSISDGLLPEWYHLLPAGTFHGRDGRGPYVFNPYAERAVLEAFASLKCDLPVDYEHQSLEAKDKSGPIPAAGWIKQLESRANGLWGRVEWTAKAQACLRDKEYRYISPVFIHDKSGQVMALTMAALTNTPNLYLTAAASREEVTAMDFNAKLCELLGLDASASEDEILKALGELTNKNESAESKEDATEDANEETKEEAQSRLSDPSKYVPMEIFKSVNSRLAQLETAQAKEKADSAVAAAMSAGKITPAQKNWAVSYASRDLAGFKDFADKAPVTVSSNSSNSRLASKPETAMAAATGALTPEQKNIAAAMGIDPARYLKTLESQKEEAE